MGDLICVRCREPWHAYGITYAKGDGDMSVEEANRFLRAEGCPSCGFGTICPKCRGGRIEKNSCPTCLGSGYVFARRCPNASDARFHQWFIGYSNTPRFPLRFLEAVEIISHDKPEQSQDGVVYVAKIKCPDCHSQGEPCSECGGDGKFHAERHGDYFEQAIASLLDNSDEEPIGVLTRFVAGADDMRNFGRKGNGD